MLDNTNASDDWKDSANPANPEPLYTYNWNWPYWTYNQIITKSDEELRLEALKISQNYLDYRYRSLAGMYSDVDLINNAEKIFKYIKEGKQNEVNI